MTSEKNLFTSNPRKLLLLLLVSAAANGMAQKQSDLSFTIRSGTGIDRYRDVGTSPLTYNGLCLDFGSALTYTRQKMLFNAQQNMSGAICQDSRDIAMSFGGTWQGGIGVMYQVADAPASSFRAWAGGGISDQFFLSYNSALENASLGYTNFFDLDLLARAELDFRLCRRSDEKRFTAFGTLQLPFVSYLLRPGYAYVANANISKEGRMKLTDDSFEKSWKAFSGIHTGAGVAYRLRNFNRIALSYDWFFHSTGNKGSNQYHHAQHLLLIELTYNLKQANHEKK